MTARRAIPVLLFVFALFAAQAAYAVSTTVVISQFQVAGGTAADEFVELHNVSAAPFDLNGHRVVYRSAAGTSDVAVIAWTTSTIIPAGGYYLIGHATGYDGGGADITFPGGGTGSFAAAGGGLALRNGAANTGTIVDSVGFGTATNAFVETAAEAAPAANTSAARQNNGCQDTDNNATDFVNTNPSAPRNSATTPVSCAGPPTPVLNINDISQAEGDAGTTTFTFTVSLTAPAGAGGVTFDIATADNTATQPGDYAQNSLTGQTIPAGSSTYAFNVTVNGDTTTEPNETFFVNVTNVVGATAGDVQGQGTIQNDDVTVTPIHDVQGPGATSPIVGSTVTIRGIVTGVKSNGFFVQEEDADVDADPATSEGIFVFTSAAPPAAAAFTAEVQVTGTVLEFVPTQDPQQPPLTEIGGSPTVVQTAPAGQPLPTPVPLSPTFPDPAGPYDQLERIEGMRVSVASMTVVAPTDGGINEPNNTGTSNGRFFAVVSGVPRPFREPGIRQPDVPPTGSIPPIPRWDSNPELLGVESAAINGQAAITVKTSDTVAPIVGPLDYGFRRYAIYPDGTSPIVVTPGTLPTVVTTPTAQEFTVGSWNIFHFYDTVNMGGSGAGSGDVVVTAGTYADRMNKASIAIRNNLKFPDILGLQEVENLAVLQDLADKINSDAVADSQPDPEYVAFLSEGNDIGGIDVGFLVKTAEVAPGLPRVDVTSVTQIGAATTWIDPDDGNPALLNDRPSIVLEGTINRGPGASFPIVVINNHLRSLIGIDSNDPDGLTTEGNRVRLKRQEQAEFLANYIQGRLTVNPDEHIVLVGDFNAFQFNDGYVDVMNVIQGTPPPDDQTVVPGDGVDLVNPDLVNLSDTPPPSERYSYIFDGNAQTLDHVVVSAGVIADTTARRIERARIAADYPETERSNANSPLRLTDHDPVVGYFTAIVLAIADVSVTKTDNVDPVNAGQNFFYTVTVNNAGPDTASGVSFSDALPAGTTFVSLSQPGGWTCTTPAVGANGTVTCSIASMAVGSAAFNITVAVNAGLASGTVLSNTATVTATTSDPNTGNETDTETTTVATSADLQISKTDTPDPVNAGSNLSYQITLTNNGPSNASATFTDTLPASTSFVSLSTTGSWTCTTPPVGTTGTITCTNTGFGVTADSFTIVVSVAPNVLPGTVLSNTASLTSPTPDPNTGNNDSTATTTVTTAADLQITKTDSVDPVTAGSNFSYTITVNNAGPSNAASVQITDAIPANTTFQSISTTGSWLCTLPPVGGTGTVTCTNPALVPGSSTITIGVNVNAATPAGTVISNTVTGTSTTTDPSPGNETDTETTVVGDASADLSITKTDTPTDPVNAGENVTYTIAVQNNGPSAATNVTMLDTIPVGTTFVSVAAPAGWTCTTPPAGGTGAVSCSIPSLGVTSAVFTLVVRVDPHLLANISNTATVSSPTSDPSGGNNTATETTTVNASADLQITKTDSPDPVTAGTNITYTITATNAGPSNATDITVADTVPAGTTFVSFAAPAGWGCTLPAVGGTGAITCATVSFPAGSVANFTLVVAVDPSAANGTVITNTATIDSATTADPNAANDTTTTATTVGVGSADLSVAKTDSPDPVNAGANLTYTITVTNAGPTNASTVGLSDTLPANTTFISLNAPAGWTCTTPAVGATGTVTCNNANVAPGSAVITLTVGVGAATAPGTIITNTANLTSVTADPNPGNETATATTTVQSPANVSGTKSVSGSFAPGGAITYTIVLTNSGASTQADNPGNEFIDVLPAQLTLVSATATSGTAAATVATNTVTWNGSIASGASVTITINATINPAIPAGTTITNQGTINYDADGNGTNESTRPTDSPSAGGASDPTAFVVGDAHLARVPTLDEWALIALTAMIAAVAMLMMKR